MPQGIGYVCIMTQDRPVLLGSLVLIVPDLLQQDHRDFVGAHLYVVIDQVEILPDSLDRDIADSNHPSQIPNVGPVALASSCGDILSCGSLLWF